MTVRSIVVSFLRGAGKEAGKTKDVTREAVMELIQKKAAADQPDGVRKGWQVKAASWVKKMHVDRGDVKVGRVVNGEFQPLAHLRPRYFVPADLDTFELKPYVEVEAPPKKAAKDAAKA
ncbi:hypothetical protein HYH03_013958 [Edaphochlamys debaryana]|uniref:Uncharacterized protein n=1 Tax=Edaphochlamys debaryana TaxID=47281 RepID=A0A836BU04_9CHLO|nr:hypothetical protein HYH03_013958 [Edaphochlamys debaryana]|eukprot:KAG2487389.1 hypothetical protein HYH03_013958 [Edaphochlamys debaryana]